MNHFAAPQRWRAIDILSDLHLDASHPLTFDAFRAHLQHTDADAVFILGDLFEVWVGDDARFGDFEARCAAVLAQAAQRVDVAFMVGNRDFLVGDALLAQCGVTALPDPTRLDAWGRALLLTHGDALCLADTDYQRFRAEVRGEHWRAGFLARPLAERQAIARAMRDASERTKRSLRPEQWADVDPAAAVALLRDAGADTMIHGHTHRPGSEALAPGFARHVLSDWDLDDASPRAEVLRVTRRGLERRPPAR